MPLPNAKPEPAGSNVYRQLNSIKLGDLTNEQFDKVYQNVFLNDMSEDELRRLALVGAARQSLSASSSGPIPGTQKMIEIDTTLANTYIDIHIAGPGEVWQFVAGSANTTSGIVGTVTTEVDIFGIDNSERLLFIDAGSSSSSDFPLNEITQSPIVYSYGQKLRLRLEGTFTSAVRTFSVVRVR
jgi:hypothetical protein